jgi:hypothetical protein
MKCFIYLFYFISLENNTKPKFVFKKPLVTEHFFLQET